MLCKTISNEKATRKMLMKLTPPGVVSIYSTAFKNACKSQKRKNILTTWLNFYAFGIFACKICSLNVDEIDTTPLGVVSISLTIYARKSQKRMKVLKTWLNFYAFGIFACKTGRGNIRPAGHIQPAKAQILALEKHILHEFGPRDTNKSPMWPTEENSCPRLL